MSISTGKVTVHLTDEAKPSSGIIAEFVSGSGEPSKKKRQTPYRPKLATTVKWALEDAVNNAGTAQKGLQKLLDWQRSLDGELADLQAHIIGVNLHLSPPDLEKRLLEFRLRIAEVNGLIAEVSYEVGEMRLTLTETLNRSQNSVPPPKERSNRNRGTP